MKLYLAYILIRHSINTTETYRLVEADTVTEANEKVKKELLKQGGILEDNITCISSMEIIK